LAATSSITPLDAGLLGVVQGGTEFLPISSSGHLRLGELLLEAKPPSLFFDVALHVGTLLATLLVFRGDIARLFGELRPAPGESWLGTRGARHLALLILGSLPTAVIGLLLEPLVEGSAITPSLVGALLLVNGAVLLSTRARKGHTDADEATQDAGEWRISPALALLIGVAQGLAVLPGISRSGATIATALWFGVRSRTAAVFSFLLSIPAIAGALLLKAADVDTSDTAQLRAALIGALVAAVVGVACLRILLGVLRRARFHHFAWYCFALGGLALLSTAL
jgi:undecaprenyl-diphosphatase